MNKEHLTEGNRRKQSACVEFNRGFAIKESSFSECRNFMDEVRIGKSQVEIEIVNSQRYGKKEQGVAIQIELKSKRVLFRLEYK